MFYHSYDGDFKTLEEMLASAARYLRQNRDEGVEWNNREPPFPQHFEMWEEKAGYTRYVHISAKQENCCGSVEGAWEDTIKAYSDPSNARFGEWEPL